MFCMVSVCCCCLHLGPLHVFLTPGRRNHFAYYNYHAYEDGSDSRDKPKLYRLQLSVTEVGTEKFDDNSIQLFGPGIQPHHCDLTNMDGVVTVTPRNIDAETYVEGQRISETTMLQSGMKVQFGSSHVFKFVDPTQDHIIPKRPIDASLMVKGPRHKEIQDFSTSRLDGDRASSASSTAERGMVKPMIRIEQQQDYRRQESSILFFSSFSTAEDAFLSAIINYTNSSTVHFKLSPTYVLYMTCRYVLSSQYRPDITPTERTHKVIAIVNKMVNMMEGVIQKQKNIAGALAFWMANASELLNFIKQDRDLSRITVDAQDVLAHLVQMAFKYLVHCLQSELNNYMPAFLDDPEENNPQRPKIDDVLHTLTGAMSLLRRCRVNAALTIQLFSQLFHFINMWLFNRLVTAPDSGLCSHYWGAIVRQQLGHIEAWAEKQGLELAADCHLSRIVQATTLLTMDKYSHADVPNINSTCFKLNSLQLQALLQNYHCAPDEPLIPTELIENVVTVAENTADELARSDGREVQLEEDPDLQLPFLLPEDGYSCDVVRNFYCFTISSEQDFIPTSRYWWDGLVTVDPRSLHGAGAWAAELMTRTGSVVTLEVAKQGAIYHGLATLLNQPSPMMQRGKKEKANIDVISLINGGGWAEAPSSFPQHCRGSCAPMRVARSQEELRDKVFQPERNRLEVVIRKDIEYIDRKSDSDQWMNSSVDSSTSSQEHLNHTSKPVSPGSCLTKSGPGRWKTPAASQPTPVAISQPIRTDLPPPPPPPPVHYAAEFDEPQMDLPLPPPPPPNQVGAQASSQVAAAERKKREEHQRWYEKEKARLEEERERKRREQERKLGQMRSQPLIPPQPVVPPVSLQQVKSEKTSTFQRPQETVIRELQPQQQPRTIERRDLQYITISKEELSSSDSLSPDPWKRDAKEKLEKQQQMHIVDMLSKEIQDLQNKPDRTAEENDRLRKLMLEWQFQKRLQESKQKDEDDDEEEDDDVDTMLIMQRLEAERRARLQDEERRRQQQLEEMRKREAEDRARQEEERRQQEEERTRREAEEKRRQEEEYYNRLEAERRRQHDEAERRLLEPDEPGLYRPPLPREYELPSPTPSSNAPPPPPQRNTSYLKTQVLSPDTIYTAKFVAYNDDEEEEDSNLAGQDKYSSTRKSYGDFPPATLKPQHQDTDLPGAPENLTFRERQRLFSQGQDVSNKVKASRKLMELENELNTK
uniref:Afadin, adherens junction formation factor n=1 Tax=Pavo cristatus TaxID=9049 RepID=A0A8C9L8Y7_PAVCR